MAIDTQPKRTTTIRTFLIADVRGYTRFTQEHGDGEAARLAARFAELAREAVEARGGRVIELRGDEALAVFDSTAQAVRAALEFQVTCMEETEAAPDLPLTVGIGVDVGEAIPVEDGFRGVALNTAARLCSKAVAGQVLVTRAVAELAAEVEEVRFEERGPAELKGFEQPVDLIEPVSLRTASPQTVAPRGEPAAAPGDAILPPELDTITPLVDREHEMHWLRGTWRQARRGHGRVVFVSGPSQIGKTRLAAEIASEIGRSGARVLYAGPGGTAAAQAIATVREAADATDPTVVVLDDLDVAGEDPTRALADAHSRLRSLPVLVIGLVKDPAAGPILAGLIDDADQLGDGHLTLSPLDLDGVEGIARLYVGVDVHDVPLESMARASGGVPGRVHEVVSGWAQDEAGRRLAAAAEWLAEGRGRRSADLEFANNVIGLKLGRLYSGQGEVVGESDCPYKGLASFDAEDAAYFFGRERLVGELAARTVQVGLLGVVGASGSGKSSAVAAGLLPSLSAGLLPGSERWRHVMFRPGDQPMAELQAALGSGSTISDAPLEAAIETLEADGRLVVVVDQFEEVFTLCTDDGEREAFIEALTGAAARRPDRIVIVLTIRDDLYGRCAPYRELSELVTANHVLVPPMTRDELRRAVELPARRARLRVESALVDALVEEVAEEPGGLPLLSAALVELWQAREDGWLRMETYERTGGVRGAVARLAEASYRELTDPEREVARRMLLRLAGVEQSDVVTRRRVQTSELDVDTDPVAAAVLARLTQDRLLTMSDSTVEVAHEALLREWPRLRGWLEEDVQGHQLRQHLTQAAKQWETRGSDASEVYRGARLSAALDWASAHGSDLNELERTFLAESRQASERDAERQRRTNRRLRGLLVGTAVFLVLALVAGGLALVQNRRAQDEAVRAENQARIATARELAAAAVANLSVDPERSILLAAEALDVTGEAALPPVEEAEEALHRALQESRVALRLQQGRGSVGIAVSPDGSRFATTGDDGTATVRETDTGKGLLTLRGHEGAVNGVAFSPDGSLLATTGEDRTAQVWDAESGTRIHVLRGHRDPVLGTAFSPDGSLLATSSGDGTVRIWNVVEGTRHLLLKGPPGEEFFNFGSLTPAFSPDGSRVVSGGWFSTPIWDLATRKISMQLPGFASAVAFSPDGTRVATADQLDVQTWDAQTAARLTTLSGHTGDVIGIAYSPDGRRIATGGDDGLAQVWDAETGHSLMSLAGHAIGVNHVAFTPDGDRLLTGGADGTARLWDISPTGGRDWLTVRGAANRQSGVAFSPDGTSFAVPGQVTGVTIRDVDTGAKIVTLEGHDARIRRMAFSPDGTRLAGSAGSRFEDAEVANNDVPIWDVTTGELVTTLVGHEGQVTSVAYSPQGRRIATGSYDGFIRLWDASSGTEVHAVDVIAPRSPRREAEFEGVVALAFSPDGRWLVSDGVGRSRSLTVWDADTLERRWKLPGHAEVIQDVAFGPDGTVVTAGFDGTAKVWDLESARELATLEGHTGPLLAVAVSPDGALVATGSLDGAAKLWDLATGREKLTLFGHDGPVNTVAFSPDGRLLATVSGDGTVSLHLLPIDELRDLARQRVTRGLTPQECQQYLHESCPPPT
jgi:WD40 repeat protein/class 3 adenylate cyclase